MEEKMDTRPGQIVAPWTDEQVINLKRFQRAGCFHPFTCGNNGRMGYHAHQVDLEPTNAGWICPECDYTQDWAHDFMADPKAVYDLLSQIRAFRELADGT